MILHYTHPQRKSHVYFLNDGKKRQKTGKKGDIFIDKRERPDKINKKNQYPLSRVAEGTAL